MKNKRIGTLEMALISECRENRADFGRISKLFDMGADINAVNEYGECVAALIFDGYCAKGDSLQTGYLVPALLRLFIENGFDIRRHGINTVSALQNSCYDKYVRIAIKRLIKLRSELAKKDVRVVALAAKLAATKTAKKLVRPKIA